LLSGSLWSTDFHLPGTPPKASVQTDILSIGPQFFETMKIPVQRGRKFKPEEYELAAKADGDPKGREQIVIPAIVNEAFVRAYFPKVNPLGQPFGAYIPGVERRAGFFPARRLANSGRGARYEVRRPAARD
jgi:hypothetical protein